MKKLLTLAFLLTFAVLAQPASAQLTLSNWTITGTSLSFDISGTYTAPESPTSNDGILWLAQIGNNTWIDDATNPSYVLTGTIDGFDVTTNPPDSVFSFDVGTATDVGAYLDFSGMPPFDPGIDFDFTDGVNDNVDIHLEMTFTETKYIPANIDPADLQLYWGGDAFSGTDTGAVPMDLSTGTVPEPSSIALSSLGLMALGAMGLRVRRRRRALEN